MRDWWEAYGGRCDGLQRGRSLLRLGEFCPARVLMLLPVTYVDRSCRCPTMLSLMWLVHVVAPQCVWQNVHVQKTSVMSVPPEPFLLTADAWSLCAGCRRQS